ncbi:MAG: DUF1579 domain-containing protein [Planctomycetota bacterium]
MKTILLTLALALGASPVQDMPEVEKLEQHDWLQHFVGDWTAKSETTMAEDAEPMKMELTESVRSIGGLWILAEGSATFGGMPMSTVLTLGYDPAKKKFVGTWVDSVQTHMYVYEGELDAAQKVLTLSTTGPDFQDPSKTAKYRDLIEVKDADNKVLTSSVQGADGAWTTFMRADYTRKKK